MKSLAAILVQQKAPLALEEIEVPRPAMGQVLVKVLTSGICGSQIGEIDGVKGPDRFLPHLLGHEGAGIVLEVGEGVRTVKPDDKVVLHWRKGAGLESTTPVYQSASRPRQRRLGHDLQRICDRLREPRDGDPPRLRRRHCRPASAAP